VYADWDLGFLHGAFFEGQDVAKKIADCIEAGGCTSEAAGFRTLKKLLYKSFSWHLSLY
jgi:hypothetical protein